MQLTENAKLVLNRFLAKDNQGKITETPKQLFQKIAETMAKEDSKYNSSKKEIATTQKEFYELMTNLDFLPNLPAIANVEKKLRQFAACFVLPLEDAIEGIFQSLKDMAIIQKTGGGTGFNFSRLRPEGSYVSETGGIASGPVSFMKVFDAATAAIKEGGIRRGANMGILRVDHPDIEKFIASKEKGGLPNFNISVAITDKFMKAVLKDDNFDLVFGGKIYKTLKAKELMKMISKHAWINGDPGVIFIDEINRHNPTPKIGEIEATNPCSEIPLLPHEACVLGSINLSNFANSRSGKIDFKRLEKTIRISIHFLDNMIEASAYPVPEIEKIVKANRKIGLGYMGFADALIKMNIAYDSPQAEKLAERIMKFLKETSIKASQELAQKRGAFPNFEQSIYRKEKKKIRNATLTAIAPTGTIAIIANCSESTEPVFSPIFNRQSTYGDMIEANPLFLETARKLKLDQATIEKIGRDGTLQNITQIPEKTKNIFKTAHDVSPEWHLKIQAAFQKYNDNAISKTINIKTGVSPEDVEKIFLEAYRLKIKSLTVYRYNSRREQILSFCPKCEIKL